MLNSINHLKKVYEPKQKKVQKTFTEKPRPKLPEGFIYHDGNIVHVYHGKDLKHFAIFSGDLLTIKPEKSLINCRRDALYAVQLRDNSARICAVKYSGFECVLHDGQGNDFQFARTSFITLIGEVLRGEKG